MNKITKNPSTALLPVPTVLVSCQAEGGKPNMITIAWTGTMNSAPPMVYIGVQPVRFSHGIIKAAGEYVINIPSSDQVKAVDYCGVTSGRDVDKFKVTGLTAVPGSKVKAPIVAECPVNLECQVKQVINLGSHDVFMAEVLAVHYSEEVLNEKGVPDLDKIRPYAFCTGEYRAVGQRLGTFGYSKKG